MEKLNNVILTVSDVTGWLTDDVLALTDLLNAYANLLGSNREGKVISYVKTALAIESEFPASDINQWFRIVINLIFYDLLTNIREHCRTDTKLNARLKQLEDSFSPTINCAASSFNNCFDEIDFEQDREGIIASAADMVRG